MRRLLHLAAAVSAMAPVSCTEGGSGAADPSLVYTVARGDLVITVRERGELQAARDTRVSSHLEGRATLIYLIQEGTVVSAGEKLAELDASEIEGKRAAQAIAVAKAEATLEQARKNFEIMEKELWAAERTAESRLKIALMRSEKFTGQERQLVAVARARLQGPAPGHTQNGGDSSPIDLARFEAGTNREMVRGLEELIAGETLDDPVAQAKYSGLVERVQALLKTEENLDREMGEMANQILVQMDDISLTRADLELAKETFHHSQNLAAKKFITSNELERDEINFQRQLSKVAVAWNGLQLLIKYTLPETLIGLEQEEENAQLGLESVRGMNEARRVREAAELKSSEAEFELAKERLENFDQQIANAVLTAPAAGLVVYGRWDWDEPVYEGMQVRERQDIVILPDVSTMIAELKVHEAQIDKVALNQLAMVKVDAFPGRNFPGRVSLVSTLPDPGPSYRDLKVFRVRVLLDADNSDGTIRPGMNGTVQINVGVLENVLNVPLSALERSGDTHYVWRVTPRGPAATEVELGGNNMTHVEIVAGLKEGDEIHLVRPPGAQPPAEEGQDATPPGGGTPPVDAGVKSGSAGGELGSR